jgi:hypothetical protein
MLSVEILDDFREHVRDLVPDDIDRALDHIEALTEELQAQRDWGHPEQRCLWGELETEYGLDGEDMDCAADVKDAMVSVLKSLTEERDRLRRLVERARFWMTLVAHGGSMTVDDPAAPQAWLEEVQG